MSRMRSGAAGHLKPSAVRGQIAFESDRDSDLDIYVIDADGSNVRRRLPQRRIEDLNGIFVSP